MARALITCTRCNETRPHAAKQHCTRCYEYVRGRDLDKKRAGQRAGYGKARERLLSYQRSYYQLNSEYIKQREHCRRMANPERTKEIKQKEYKQNKAGYIRRARERELKQKQQTPPWLSAEHQKLMQQTYEQCPRGYEVDHIVPLKGRNVSGLNVPWNLQYLPADENRRKGNKHESDET